MFQHVKAGGEHARGEEKPFNTSSDKNILTVHTNTKTQSDTVLQESFQFNLFKSKKSDLYRTTVKSDRESLATIPPPLTENNLCSHPKFFNSHWAHMLPHSQPGLKAVPLRGETPQNEFQEILFFTQSVELHDVFSACEVGFNAKEHNLRTLVLHVVSSSRWHIEFFPILNLKMFFAAGLYIFFPGVERLYEIVKTCNHVVDGHCTCENQCSVKGTNLYPPVN